jgi:hypothetical protein
LAGNEFHSLLPSLRLAAAQQPRIFDSHSYPSTMTTPRVRGLSPPARRYVDPRVNSGPVFSTAFDTRYAQQPSNSIDTLNSYRPGAERLVDAQPISRRKYAVPGGHSAQSKTEYAVRARNNSRVDDDARTPLRLLVAPTSPARSRPVVENGPREQPRSPLPRQYYPPGEVDRYILPAVSNPRRHQHQDEASPADSAYLTPGARDLQERSRYRVSGGRVYPASGALVRYDDEDDYSYTTPREQFDRDYPPPEPRPRYDSYVSQKRPISTSNFDGWQGISQPMSQPMRETGPPPAVRQFDKIGKGDPRYSTGQSGNHSDTERDIDRPRRRHSLRAPVSLHQNREEMYLVPREEYPIRGASRYQPKPYDDEPGYSSDRENYRPSSHYERHNQRPKFQEESHDRSARTHGVAAAGLGGLTVAGLTSAIVKKHRDKDDDSDRDEIRDGKDRYTRERDHQLGDTSIERERAGERPRDRAAELRDDGALREHRRENGRKERSDSDSIDDGHADGQRHRRKHRRPRRESRPQELELDSTSDDGNVLEMSAEVDKSKDRAKRESALEDVDGPRHDRRLSRTNHRTPPESAGDSRNAMAGIEGDGLEERTARLQLVEPPKEKENEPKPKGILKPARQVPFPEDPNPTREGVAPLKDAGKKGIPPGARWTKINRMLVNPAALEAAHERYEERDDYVIVLRVLSRDEIQKYADKTKEIRGKQFSFVSSCIISLKLLTEARELEWRERQDLKRRKDERRNNSTGESSDDEQRPRLAIEAAPLPSNTGSTIPASYPLQYQQPT